MSKVSYKNLLLKKNKCPITCLTAYSKPLANLLDGKVDLILVGDSVGTTLYGMKNTRGVTLEMMKNHGQAVVRNTKYSMSIIDMPYNTYRNKIEALRNAKKIIKETKCDAVKLEGGLKILKIVEHLIKNKISVMGHLGILPQSVKGKFKYKGKKISERKRILNEAILLQNKGVFSIVLECIETSLAKEISKSLVSSEKLFFF